MEVEMFDKTEINMKKNYDSWNMGFGLEGTDKFDDGKFNISDNDYI